MRAVASSALPCVLAGKISSAPLWASASAASNPMPLFAPVITALRPACEGIFFVVSEQHPLADRKEITVAELSTTPLAIVSNRTAARTLLDGLFADRQLKPNIVIEIDDLDIAPDFEPDGTFYSLIAHDGRLYTVSAGDTVLSGGLSMKVVGVTAAEVRIEIAALKEVIVLN